LIGFQATGVDREFLLCIDRAFTKFDESRANSIFSKFETDYNLSRSDILSNPELFSKTLRSIFRFGFPYVERSIISELRDEFHLPERNYYGLTDAVREIRKSIA